MPPDVSISLWQGSESTPSEPPRNPTIIQLDSVIKRTGPHDESEEFYKMLGPTCFICRNIIGGIQVGPGSGRKNAKIAQTCSFLGRALLRSGGMISTGNFSNSGSRDRGQLPASPGYCISIQSHYVIDEKFGRDCFYGSHVLI